MTPEGLFGLQMREERVYFHWGYIYMYFYFPFQTKVVPVTRA